MAKLGLMIVIAAAVALASCSRQNDLFADLSLEAASMAATAS